MDKEFWEGRYKENKTGWDIGNVSLPLKDYFDQIENKDLKILIPGCGNAYEAIYLWENGFKNVFMLDISSEVVANFKRENPNFPADQIICEDFFTHSEQYDLIVEQTFFCALHPSKRKKYVTKMASILEPSGKIMGLLFKVDFDGGPPFGGSQSEYEDLFEKEFELIKMEECYNSIEPRKGAELFFMMKLKPQ